MTPLQRRLARSLHNCTFLPGTPVKRFARDLASRANDEDAGLVEDKPLTEKQCVYLYSAVHRYRRRIPADDVAEASAQLRKLDWENKL